MEQLILSFFVAGLVIGTIATIYGVFDKFFGRRFRMFFSPYTDNEIHHVLNKYLNYYKSLNKSAKQDFIKSTQYFLTNKKIIPNRIEINNFTKIIISSLFSQITFGKKYKIENFNDILLYKDSYKSTQSNQLHNGEVNVHMRLIVLSLKNVLEGIADPNDGINLALHELAHAFKWNNIMTRKNIDLTNNWISVAKHIIIDIQNDPNHFLRQYASTNIHEMFAVCTENFFERAIEFHQKLPELYDRMVDIYNQDPRFTSDPRKY